MKTRKLLVALILVAFSTITIAAEPDQSHNLSEIDPVDVDFNMSDKSIFNLSQVKLNDGTVDGTGLVLDDYSIRDSGSILKLDSSNGYWKFVGSSGDIARFKDGGNVEIPNGNLDLSSNSIVDSGSNFFGGCSSGQYVESINSDGSVNCSSDNTGDTSNSNEIQDLGYNNQNSPTGNYVNHEITISDGGSNTNIRDYYEPDDYDPNSDASTQCSGDNTFLDGNGNCRDITNNYGSPIHGDLIQSNTVDGGEIQEGTLDCSAITGGGGLCDGGDAYEADTTIPDNQDIQASASGDTVNIDIDNGNGASATIDDDYDPNTDTQDLSISGHTVSLDNGGSVTVPDNYEADTNADTECSGSDYYLAGDGTCSFDSYSPDQDLSSSRNGDTVTIEINAGSDASFTDNYEANTDNQGLGDVLSQNSDAGSEIIRIIDYVNINGAETSGIGDLVDTGNGGDDTIDIGGSSFTTDLDVSGTLSKSSGSFEIDHPQNDSKVLRHGFSESPRRNVFYQGTTKLENGSKEVQLPDYFEKLTQEDGRHVQLTPKNGWSPLYVDGKVRDGSFTVKTTGKGDEDQKFHWRVDAERGDEYVRNEDSQTYHSGPKEGDLIVEAPKNDLNGNESANETENIN